jgi:sugar lactone lactonase YvrE
MASAPVPYPVASCGREGDGDAGPEAEIHDLEGPEMVAVTVLDGIKFPEGLRWHDGRLWFSDIHDHRVYAMTEDGTARVVAELPDMPSGRGWLPGGSLVVVLMRSRRIVKIVDGRVEPHADLVPYVGDHLNDMVVDGAGNGYAGSITHRGFADGAMDARRSPVRECIVLVRPDGSTALAADDVIGPNGSVITPDGRTLIVAETRAMRITAFDIADDGMLINRRPFAALDPGRADGLALDAEGALRCGLGTCFGRVVEGEIVDRVHVAEGRNAVACALGGHDRRTLYMATNVTSTTTLSRIHRAEAGFEDELTSDATGWIDGAQGQPAPGTPARRSRNATLCRPIRPVAIRRGR